MLSLAAAALLSSLISTGVGVGTDIASNNRLRKQNEEEVNRANINAQLQQINNMQNDLNQTNYDDLYRDRVNLFVCGGKRKMTCGGKKKMNCGGRKSCANGGNINTSLINLNNSILTKRRINLPMND